MTKHILLLAAALAAISPGQAQAQFDPAGVVRHPRPDHADQWVPVRPAARIEEPRDPIIFIFMLAGAYAGYSLGKNQEKDYFFGERAPVYSVLAGAVVGVIVGKNVQDRVLGPDYGHSRSRPGYRESANFIRTRGTDTVSVESVFYEDGGVQGQVVTRSGNFRYAGRANDRNAVQVTPGSIGMDELLTQRAVRTHETEIPTVDPAGDGAVHVAHVRTLSPGRLHVDYGGSDLQADVHVDRRGRILSATYMSPTEVVTVRRVGTRG